jgi:DNA-binding SARP family transcriptional activator
MVASGGNPLDTPSFRLRLFGGLALEKPSGPEDLFLSQRRVQAVLATLALCGKMGCTRDRMIAYFWPESDERHGRHNLRDAVYTLRSTLGRDAVMGQGDILRLNPSIIATDVAEFTRALSAGLLADAVDIYTGPLLNGFHIDAAPEWERWIEGERTRMFQECVGAFKRLAKKAENQERWDEAARWWGRAVALDSYNSRLVVRRIIALGRRGDRANAIQEGEAHIRLLRSELNLDPDPSFLEELERIRQGDLGPVRFFTPPVGSPAEEPTPGSESDQ